MENDETTLDVQEEQQEDEVVETTEEEVEEPVEEAEEPVEEPAEELAPKPEEVTLKPSEYRQFKKWEKNRRPKAQPVSPQPDVEAVVLQAQGMPDELLKELKAVAGVRGTSLIKAQSDPIFVAVKEKFESDQKKAKASMPVSRGAGGVKVKKDPKTPGLSREEHKAMVQGL